MWFFLAACTPHPAPADTASPADSAAATVAVDSDRDGTPDVDDCAPGDPAVFPGAPEVADGRDDDCDGSIDNPVGASTAAAWTSGSAAGDALGTAAIRVEDRLWIGVPGSALAEGGEGRLLGFDLPATGALPLTAPAAEVRGETADGALGTALYAADLDGDGLPELCTGVPGAAEVDCFDPRFSDVASSRAAVYTFEGGRAADRVGAAITSGDFDDDGTIDVAIGAPAADGPGGANDAGAGAVFLALDATATTRTDLAPPTTGPFRDTAAGTALIAEDLDGDGIPSLLVGVPILDFPGRVYLLDGDPPPSLGDLSPWYEGAADADGSGTALAGGDIDGDGYHDVVVGIPGLETVGIVYGSPSAGTRTGVDLDATLVDPAATGFGGGVALVDPDGDGRAGVAVGADGQVSVFPGPFLGTTETTSLVIVAPDHGPLRVAGDADIVVSDPDGAGITWLFPGWGASR